MTFVAAKLSSSGSDSEDHQKTRDDDTMETDETANQSEALNYTYDDNAQDYAYAAAESTAGDQSQNALQMSQYDFNDENSFDPNEFFRSFANNQVASNAAQGDSVEQGTTGIDIDLAVSESDEENENDLAQGRQETALPPGGEEFNFEEFMQQWWQFCVKECSVYILPGVTKYPGDVSVHARISHCH